MTRKRTGSRRKKGTSLPSTVWFGLLGILLLGAVSYGIIQQGQPKTKVDDAGQQITAAEVGALAPDFELPLIDGKLQKLSDYRGKPVVLTFMHTW